MRIFHLVPIAAPDDPNWDNAANHGTVSVCAHSPADARIVAAEAETDFLDISAKPGDGTTTDFASAFRNDKLYTVQEAEEADAEPSQRGLIRRD
ncbi:hypothetical protein KY465_08300 [Pseudohoeflea sp. DP4N28-3]|uniref:Uncharacterized protein n=1 Tax=Pseudohoeflea coraliihabitans TaxID=2860393 RepID=A0ABS6WMU0_9HYPH|nr:hypothetical protein [Pseudohoeflea sp. DP4N28-3]